MTRVVLDTNTLVSGLGWPDSPPGKIWKLVDEQLISLVTSPLLLDELERVLSYEKLRAVFGDEDQRARLVQLVRAIAIIVQPEVTFDVVERDPDDNRVLEAAVAGDARYVVTGDEDLLELGVFEEVVIISPAKFASEIEPYIRIPQTEEELEWADDAGRAMIEEEPW